MYSFDMPTYSEYKYETIQDYYPLEELVEDSDPIEYYLSDIEQEQEEWEDEEALFL